MASDYPAGFYFQLSFKGEDAAFQEVSGISKELGIEEVWCGGENRFKYRLPTVATSQNLVLKRAFVLKDSELVTWCSESLEGSLAYQFYPQNITLSLLGSDGQSCKTWLFHQTYPVKYAVSDLKSQENELVLETVELAYSYFEIIPPTQDTMFGNMFD